MLHNTDCYTCANHSVKDGVNYCNNRIVKTLKGQLCYCDIPCKDCYGSSYCSYVKRTGRKLIKEA